MSKRIEVVRTEDCPCEGKHSWNWHKKRSFSPCRRSQDLKHRSRRNWENNAQQQKDLVRRVLTEDPAKIDWVSGTPIFLDEEEVGG